MGSAQVQRVCYRVEMNVTSETTPFNFPAHALEADTKKKVVFCIPTISKPYKVCLDSLEASIPVIVKAGWEEGSVYQIGCPYISAARSMMLRKALDAKATVVVFIDHDLRWKPEDLLRLIETPDDVVAGVYRFKGDPEQYMGCPMTNADTTPIVREDGCIKMLTVPAGFLKITRQGVNKFMMNYPELMYGERCSPLIDLFNHGAHKFTWYGEDYAFSRNWNEKCGDIWAIPDMDIDHQLGDGGKIFEGNYHEFMLRQPGGSESDAPVVPIQLKFAA